MTKCYNADFGISGEFLNRLRTMVQAFDVAVLTELVQRPCQTAAALTFGSPAAVHGGDVGSSGLTEDGKTLVLSASGAI